MTNQRIDIDQNRWIEIRDGLVYFVRFRKRGLEIVIAPREQVRIADDWAFGQLDRISPATYMCALAIPVLAFCALAVGLLSRRDSMSELALAALIAVPVTILASYGLSWLARRVAGNSIPLTIDGFANRVVTRVPSDERLSVEMRSSIQNLPDSSTPTGTTIPMGVRYVLKEQNFVLPVLSILLALGSIAPSFFADDEGGGSSTISALFALAAVGFGIVQFGTRAPTIGGEREIRRALYKQDLDRAALLLQRKLAEKPDDPQANFLAMAPALLNGDFQAAAGHSTLYEEWSKHAWSMPFIDFPTEERLRALNDYGEGTFRARASEEMVLERSNEQTAR